MPAKQQCQCTVCLDHLARTSGGIMRQAVDFGRFEGWRYQIESWMGVGFFSHPDAKVSIYATPDWERAGVVDVQVMTEDGDVIGGDVLPFVGAERTLERFHALVKPFLDKYQPEKRVWLEVGYGLAGLTRSDVARWEVVGRCAHGHEMRSNPEHPDRAVDLECDAELALCTSRTGASVPKQYLTVRFDVTGLTELQIDALTGEVIAQGEESDHHPTVAVEVLP